MTTRVNMRNWVIRGFFFANLLLIYGDMQETTLVQFFFLNLTIELEIFTT